MRRRWLALATAVAVFGVTGTSVARAGNGANTYDTPVPPASPASDGSAAVGNKTFSVGAGGVYAPIPPTNIKPGASDPGGSSSAAPPYPAPNCPGGFSYIQHSPGVYFYPIFPSFSRNAQGGYDGHDAWFGYDVPNAIQPGGNPNWTDNGYPATEANMAGHIIAVDLEIGPTSAWDSFSLQWSRGGGGIQAPSPAGTCDNGDISYGFGQTYIDGPAPASAPPANALNNPWFGLGPTLLANVTGTWRIGSVGTLPGPGSTAPTFVHIPTCAWLDSGVPTAPTTLHTVTSTLDSDGYTLFLVYNVSVTPGPVSWDWGDGTRTASTDAPESAPTTLPNYDAASQTWTDSCSVSHAYNTVNNGRTITATQTFSVAINVIWSDGVGVEQATVNCDRVTNGPCVLTIGAAEGWQSGPHPVDQIEPVPFSPTTGG